MSDIKHRTRLEIVRDNIVIGTVSPEIGGDSNDFKISATSSVNSFPTASFESSNPDINSLFMSYSKPDLMRISICSNIEDQFSTMFEGEFYKKQTKYERDTKLTINVQAIHSFFRLSLLELSSIQEFKNVTFREFVDNLLKLTGIKSKVHIDTSLEALSIRGLTRNTNAFRLFKEVCLIMNASINFNMDNSVDINSRSERLKLIQTQEPVCITDKDIISSEITDQI